jgi:predicted HicB family RNase H-like nuclease
MRQSTKFLALSQYGAIMAPMKADRKDSRSSALERINLRLSPEVLEAIDAECSRRAGNVSRNTWITEAVTERLARLGSSSRTQGAGGANG